MKIKVRRISEKDKIKLGITGQKPVKYLYRQTMVNGKRIKKRIH